VIQRSTLMLLGGAFAFLDRFEAGARIPLYLQDGAAAGDRTMMFAADPASGAAMGDITLHGKARLWKHGGAAIATGLQLTIPTAEQDSFTGTEKPSLRAIAIGSLTPDTLEHRISLTGHFRRRRAREVRVREHRAGERDDVGAWAPACARSIGCGYPPRCSAICCRPHARRRRRRARSRSRRSSGSPGCATHRIIASTSASRSVAA
jgi:hypothetical protein